MLSLKITSDKCQVAIKLETTSSMHENDEKSTENSCFCIHTANSEPIKHVSKHNAQNIPIYCCFDSEQSTVGVWIVEKLDSSSISTCAKTPIRCSYYATARSYLSRTHGFAYCVNRNINTLYSIRRQVVSSSEYSSYLKHCTFLYKNRFLF